MFVRNSVAEFLSKVTAESLVMISQHTVSETLDPICVHAMNKVSLLAMYKSASSPEPCVATVQHSCH